MQNFFRKRLLSSEEFLKSYYYHPKNEHKELPAKERATEESHNNNQAYTNRGEFTISLVPNDSVAEEEGDKEEEGKSQITSQYSKALC